MLGRRQGFADIRIAIGRIAPVDASLTRRKQTASPGAFLNQGAFVLGKHALHLQQHLFFWARAQVMLDKNDFTATAVEFLDQEYLIGIAPRETIGCRHKYSLKNAFGRQIAQTVERGSIESAAADAFIDKHARGRDVIAYFGSRLVEQLHLTGYGVFTFLFFGRDARI